MRESLSHARYLAELASRECQTRNHSRIQRLMRNSRLLHGKTWDQFQWSRVPLQVARQLQNLREGSFLDRRENVLVFRKPGSGKTHILSALGEQLVQQGRTVLFATCSFLVAGITCGQTRTQAQPTDQETGGLSGLDHRRLGVCATEPRGDGSPLHAVAERYERGSVLLTSNLPFSHWQQIFKDPMTTAAAIDRLVHHSVIIELNLRSYRLETAENSHKPTSDTPPADTAA